VVGAVQPQASQDTVQAGGASFAQQGDVEALDDP